MASKSSKLKKKQALPFKRLTAFSVYPEDLHLETDPKKKHYDPRVHYKPKERDVRGIMRNGVLTSVLVEKCGSLVVVVDGRQRVLAAREANRRLQAEGLPRVMIPVVPKRGSEADLFRMGVICNNHRQQDDPVAEAYKIQQYLNMGHNEEEVAELWGVVPRTISNRLKLLELSSVVQQAVTEGRITATKALRLTNLSYEDQELALSVKPKPRAAKRPSKQKIERVLDSNGALPLPVRVAIQWATGKISDEEAGKLLSALGQVLNAKERAEE